MNWLTIYYRWSRLSLKFFEDKSHVTTEVMSVVFYQSIQGMCCCGVILQHCHPCWQNSTMTLQVLSITVCHFLLKSFACTSCGCTWHSVQVKSRYTSNSWPRWRVWIFHTWSCNEFRRIPTVRRLRYLERLEWNKSPIWKWINFSGFRLVFLFLL